WVRALMHSGPRGGGGCGEGVDLLVCYQNVGGGCAAAHEFLEHCAGEGAGVVFVGEPWVDRGGSGSQSHPDFVLVGKVARGARVLGYVRRDLVDLVLVVTTESGFVCVGVGD